MYLLLALCVDHLVAVPIIFSGLQTCMWHALFLEKKLTQIGQSWQCSLSNFYPLLMCDRFCSACLFSELFLCCRSKNFLVRCCVVGLLFDLIKSLDCLSNYEATKEFLQDPICCFPPNKGGSSQYMCRRF